MRFEVLGPLRVSHEGADVTPRGRVQRLLLAVLLIRANRPVSADALADAVWPDESPGLVQGRMQLAVHRLRSRLDDPDRLTLEAGGYRLRVAEGEYDVTDFDALAVRLLMEQMTPDQTAAVAQHALALCRGRAFEDIVEVAAAPEVTRCEERRRWVFETWCEAEIVRGRHPVVVAELEVGLATAPYDERLAVLLMRALRAGGRPSDALAVYERTRVALRDELGLDPGPELQEEQARVLAGESGTDSAITGANAPAQLPPSVGLTGREDELAALGDPGDARLSVVTGMAGVGKTALALAWAHHHRAEYPDGQLFVDLRGFSDDPPVAPAVALEGCLRSLGVSQAQLPVGLQERSGLFRSLVASRRVLVVLDNARSSDQVRPLLPGGSSCTVLVTSRDTLPGLAARDDAAVVDVKPLREGAATELLAASVGERATGELAAVESLARLCGELPLALRVAAQQVVARTDQSIAELVDELVDERDRLDLLDAGDGAATDVRAVLSWSYESLDPGSARVFRMLGLLPGTDIDAHCLAVMCELDQRELRRCVDTLVRAHLVDRSASGRHRQHDLLRAYAREQARRIESAERNSAAARLLRCYASTAAVADDVSHPDGEYNRPEPVDAPGDPVTFADIAEAQNWLDQEWSNVLAAVEDCEDNEAPTVFALARAYSVHLRDNGRLADGLRLHARELELAQRVGAEDVEGTARMGLGNIRRHMGDHDGAEAEYRAALRVREHTGDQRGYAAAVGNLGTVALERGRLARAEECFGNAVELLRVHGAPYAVAIMLYCWGDCRIRGGDAAGAECLLGEALGICDEADLPFHRPDVLVGLARAACDLGDPERAERYAVEAERCARQIRVRRSTAMALAERGRAYGRSGRIDAAHDVLREATTLVRETGVVCTMAVLAAYVAATKEEQIAVAMHREAIAYAVDHGFRGYEAGLRASLAEVLDCWGDADGAAAELARAAEIYTELDDPRAAEVTARLPQTTTAAPARVR